MTHPDTGRRLKSFQVSGLFGEFNHFIPLNCDKRVTALIGPNGLGKTACLKLISALFRRYWSVFASTEFTEAMFAFSDGVAIKITRVSPSDSTEVSDSLGVQFELFDANGAILETWMPRLGQEQLGRTSRIEHFLPFISRTGSKSWSHDLSGQTYTLHELVETFEDLLPAAVISQYRSSPSPMIEEVIGAFDCHLIETQRLFDFQPDDGQRGGGSSLSISRKAQILKSVIAKELAEYASTSQSLDRSFPRRVLGYHGPRPSPESISSKLGELDKLRRGLTEAGILDAEAEDALPSAIVSDSAIASVLNIYIEDTHRKLNVLSRLREKILLFIDLMDGRLKPKSLKVDKSLGFLVERSPSVIVPLDKLSSGEQHQLVLFFELLFELKSDAIILIDEPELSLHVGWQKQFIDDMMKIIALNGFDVLLATHSPQLIGAWDDLVVELGDVDP